MMTEEEMLDSMQRRVYWALIVAIFGLCFAFFGLVGIPLFVAMLIVGALNPDDIIKGKAGIK